MSTPRTPPPTAAIEPERTPVPDPGGQSPDQPIEFAGNNEVARGNAERANAEPEPQALSSAKVPGVTDPVEERRRIEAEAGAEAENT